MLVKALLAVGLAVCVLQLVLHPGDRLQTLVPVGGTLVAYVASRDLTTFDNCRGCPAGA